MTTVHHTPPPGATPFPIYEDPADQDPPSPSEVYEGELSFNSVASLPGADEAIPSIEQDHDASGSGSEPEPYNGSFTSLPSTHSRRGSSITSLTTNSYISTLPSELSVLSKPVTPATGVESRYTPRKERPSFRNPASVRAMQLSSPPPFDSPRERTKGLYKLSTPSRTGRPETPMSTTGSRRSLSQRGSIHRELHSPRPTPTPSQNLPLVLLHVTILPLQLPYSHDMMAKIMPHWLVENYKLLEEKLHDIVLMRRGLLIPHPRDEYDLLEERILESLELKMPRLLKCGHFVGPDGDAYDYSDDDDSESVANGRGSRMSGGTLTSQEEGEWKCPAPEADDESVCTDCHRQVKKPGKGIGLGRKRWDIKIYAANGLMRAGAWSAAWSEMERCDVEISPWIPDDVRKTLEKRLQEEEEAQKMKQLYAAEVQRRVDEEAARLKKLEADTREKARLEEIERQKRAAEEAADLLRKLDEEAAEKKRFEEALTEKIEEAKEIMRMEFESSALAESNSVAERFRAMEDALKKEEEKATVATQRLEVIEPQFDPEMRGRSRGRPRSSSRRRHVDEIPLGTLLRNYVLLLLRDQKNWIIVLLSALVIVLSMNLDPNWSMQLRYPTLPTVVFHSSPDASAPMVVTTTATTISTAISTTTVTRFQVPEIQETAIPSSATVISISGEVDSSSIIEHAAEESEDSSAAVAVEASSAEETTPEPSDASLVLDLPIELVETSEPALASAPAENPQTESIHSDFATFISKETQASSSTSLTPELELDTGAPKQGALRTPDLDELHDTTCPNPSVRLFTSL